MLVPQSTDAYQVEIRPVVLNLLRQAVAHCQNAEGQHAEAFYRAAVAADLTPLSQIEYASFLAVQEQYDRAIPLLLESWESAKRLSSPILRALACHNLAAIYRQLDRSGQAFQFQQLAISAEMDSLESGESGLNGAISEESRLGQALDDLLANNLIQAHDSLTALEKSSTDPETRAVCQLNLAQIAVKHGQTLQALAHSQSAFSLARLAQDAPTLLSSLEQLTELLTKCGRWHQAVQCVDRARGIAQSLGRTDSSQFLSIKSKRLKNALGFLKSDPILN